MIRRETRGSVLVLTLEHGKANAFDPELLEALDEQLSTLGDARALVVTGTGRIFSAGFDLRRFLDEGYGYAEHLIRLFTHVFRQAAAVEIPMVAAINGHAIAGGGILAAVADLRLMAEGPGRIGVPELLVGVPFPPVALETVRFAWPRAGLGELIFRGQTFEGTEARRLGLVDDIVPREELLEEALRRAGQLASLEPESCRLVKRQLRGPLLERIDRQEKLFGSEVVRIWEDPSTRERIAAYLERTLPR